ncbi:MAG: DUF1565 domain-containing protein [bacterium]
MNIVRSLFLLTFLSLVVVCGSQPTFAKVVYVSLNAAGDGSGSSWENACTSVSAGMTASASGDEVWVKSGRYMEAIRMKPHVALYGGFAGTEQIRENRDWTANETIIDATGLNSNTVVGANDAILDGFTVTGGDADWIGGDSDCGGGLHCEFSSPTLANCTITENRASHGGGLQCEYSSPTLINCTITGNAADWGGGGVSCYQSSATLTNCTITGNTAVWGGGVDCYGSSPTLTNCTFYGNSAANGNALACDSHEQTHPSTVEMANCILWDGGDEIWNNDGSTITISYSDIQGGWPGIGNINADPLFVDSDNGDYHLQNSSPCIDAGDPDPSYNDASLPPGLGTERCDMGAYGGPGNSGWAEPQEPVAVREWMVY